MSAFKRRLARLTTTLSYTTTKKRFILTSGHGDERRTGMHGLIDFFIFPQFQKYEAILDFYLLEDTPFIFGQVLKRS